MNNKSRTLINVIGLPIIVSTILIGDLLFILFAGLIILLGTKEYIDLLKKHSIIASSALLYLFQIFLIVLSVYYSFTIGLSENINELPIDYNGFTIDIILVSFSMPIVLLFFLMIQEIFKKSSKSLSNISCTIFGFIWIGVFINSLVFTRYMAGPILMLVIFLSLWACDTFAFFFGKKFGKTKIMPDVSPNKTVLGSVCGLFGSILILLILSYFKIIELNLFESFILGLITGGLSQFGDFFESKLKREINIKDTSNILSGHGGVLDRFDSLMIISPLLLFFVYIVK